MPTEVIDILDTAVKIGLGGLISGVATYLVTKQSYQSENRKQFFLRKLSSLEAIATHVDEFCNAIMTLSSHIDGAKRTHPTVFQFSEEDQASVDVWNHIGKADEAFCKTRAQLSSAVTKLRLLSLHNEANILSDMCEVSNELRGFLIFDKKMPDKDTLDNWVTTILSLNNEFLNQLSKEYRA